MVVRKEVKLSQKLEVKAGILKDWIIEGNRYPNNWFPFIESMALCIAVVNHLLILYKV